MHTGFLSFFRPVILACLGLAASLTAHAESTGQQLIRNGNFESLLEGWFLEQHAPALGDLTLTDEGPAGARSAKIELLEPGDQHWKLSLIQHPIPLRGDKRYRISFMAKADQQRWIAVGLMQHLAPYKVLAGASSVEVGSSWARVSVLLRPYADEPMGRFSIGNLGQVVGTLWVTDIKMVEE